MPKTSYYIIGVMSGTSCDGLDLAYCHFTKNNDKWDYKVIEAITYNYSIDWKNKLRNAQNLNSHDFVLLNNEFGEFIAEKINLFISSNSFNIDYISSHGHTIFHNIAEKLTFQIGSGACIAANTRIKTISDFRTLDVALNGQGAPLVPIGDEILFSEYDYCLNLGGFANISYKINSKRIAYDICPINFVINYLTSKYLNLELDFNGNEAIKGQLNLNLLNALNNLKFYKTNPPKSLAREWVEKHLCPIIENYDISVYDKLRTFYEHVAIQIGNILIDKKKNNTLITGGGAFNNFLIKLIKQKTNSNIIIPSANLINFKEAIVFAFLGLLRVENQINTLSDVTGATKNSSGGIIYFV